MRRLASILATFLVLTTDRSIMATSKAPTPVAASGETRISYSGRAFRVDVKISTHQVNIGKPSDPRPKVRENSCTFSRFPCSLVDRVEIKVNGRDLFVPRSVFCGLADVTSADIRGSEADGVLALRGGDASESFIVKLEFDENRIVKKSLYPGMAAGSPVEETTFHQVVLDH